MTLVDQYPQLLEPSGTFIYLDPARHPIATGPPIPPAVVTRTFVFDRHRPRRDRGKH